MKRFIVLSILFLFVINTHGQNLFGLKEITKENKEEAMKAISNIPKFSLKASYKTNGALPAYVDNSKNKYFPPIVSQISNSCGCASIVHYIYTYEMNRFLDRASNSNANIANYMYIWNFLNEGLDYGTFPWDVADAIKYYGFLPNSMYTTNSSTEWPYGYDKYYKSMNYSISALEKFNSEDANDLLNMKRYLYNHGDGSQYGGLIQFSGFAHPLNASQYNRSSYTGYNAIIPYFGYQGMHSMTIVGYDDSIWYDYNGNRRAESDEFGAFICVNSWGTNWGDNGRFYAPYMTFSKRLRQGMGGTGNGGKDCFIIKPMVKQPQLVFKILMSHTSRNDLSIGIGAYDDGHENNPVFTKNLYEYNHMGGDHPLRGIYGSEKEKLEVAIDVSELANYDVNNYYIELKNYRKGRLGDGHFYYASLLDYRNDPMNPVEYVAKIDNTNLTGTGKCRAVISKVMKLGDGVKLDVDYIVVDKDFMLVLRSIEKSYFKMDLLSETGEKVYTIIDQDVEKGYTQKKFNFKKRGIEKGTYFLRTSSNGKIEYSKIKID